MPPLKSLEQEFPMIDSNFRRFCASHGIFSVEDFLVNDLYVLTASAEREPISEALKQGMAQVLSVVDRQHQPWLNGMDLLGDAWRNKRVLPTGCQGCAAGDSATSWLTCSCRVDCGRASWSSWWGLLHRAKPKTCLADISGQIHGSAPHWLQVCLHAAAHIVERLPGTVMFLDSGNSFSAERISCILDLSSTSTSLVNESKERRCHRVLSSISCQSVFDIFELLDVLHQLDITLRHQVKNEVTKLRLLIIDSISSLITPILGGKDSHGRSLMISAGSALKRLAFNHNLSVLVTNHMVGGEGGISKPALGESWKSIPHVRLLLSRDHGSDLCIVSVLKHSSMALGCTAKFVI